MKNIIVSTLLTVSFFSLHASWDVLFCTNADTLGKCKGIGETFIWEGDNTSLQLIVLNNEKLGLDKLRYMVFAMQNDKEGKLYAELSLAVKANALFAVKKIYFYKPGYYKVDVLDAQNNFLTSGFVTVSERVQ